MGAHSLLRTGHALPHDLCPRVLSSCRWYLYHRAVIYLLIGEHLPCIYRTFWNPVNTYVTAALRYGIISSLPLSAGLLDRTVQSSAKESITNHELGSCLLSIVTYAELDLFGKPADSWPCPMGT